MSTTDNNKPDPSDVHELLGNRRRLLVVGYLSLFKQGTTIEVRHIARVVRGIETGTSPRQVSTDKYESAYNGLIQSHLPKLAARGLIEYEEDRKEVTVMKRVDRYATIIAISKCITSYG